MTKNRKAIRCIRRVGIIILLLFAIYHIFSSFGQKDKTYNVNFLESLTLEQMLNVKEEGIPLEDGTILEPRTSEDRRTLLIMTRLVEIKTEVFIPFEYGNYVSEGELEKRIEVLKDKVPGRSLKVVTQNGKKGVKVLIEDDTGNYSKLFLAKCSNKDFEEASEEEGINSTLPKTDEDKKILESIIACNEGNSFILLQNEEDSIVEENIEEKLEIINQKFNKHYMEIGEKMIDVNGEETEKQKVILIQ